MTAKQQFNSYEVCSTNLIRTGRLTRPLPIIRGITGYITSTDAALTALNSRILEQSGQHLRMPVSRKCPINAMPSEHITFMEEVIPLHPNGWGLLA
jgi:hypothetical protein